jgi:preprotein translocase subunit SecG
MLILGFWSGFLAFLFLVVAVVMILAILIQRPKGGGLAGAFGGAGGSTQTFGSKTGDVLTGITVGLFVLFLCLGIAMVYVTRPGPGAGAQPQMTGESPGDAAAGQPAGDEADAAETPVVDQPAPDAADVPAEPEPPGAGDLAPADTTDPATEPES